MVGRQRSIELALRAKSPAEAEKIRTAVKRELLRLPRRTASPAVGHYHHVQMTCPLECCKKCEEFTERDTKVDSLSVGVVETHKTKPKAPTIPPSPCCPICWMRCVRCCLPKIRTTDIHEQDIFHHSGTENIRVTSTPKSDISAMLRIWFFGGICGAHLFKANRVRQGILRLFLLFLIGMFALTASSVWFIQRLSVDWHLRNECPRNTYCTGNNNDHCGHTSSASCQACPSGKFSPAGSRWVEDCSRFFEATEGYCTDVPGGVMITTESECSAAAYTLRKNNNVESCGQESCGQSYTGMPIGCVDTRGWSVVLNAPSVDPVGGPLESAPCGKEQDFPWTGNCLCTTSTWSCPANEYCTNGNTDDHGGCLDGCTACPTGRFSPQGSKSETACTLYFMAISGYCSDVPHGAVITNGLACSAAAEALRKNNNVESCGQESCGQSYTGMPIGCVDTQGWSVVLKAPSVGGPLESAPCGKEQDFPWTGNCLCTTSTWSCPANEYCTNGNTDNHGGCLDGCTACPAGKISPEGSTSETSCFSYAYGTRTSGRCTDTAAWSLIPTEEECKTAAEMSGFIYEQSLYTEAPTGCFNYGGSIYFNTRDTTRSCSSAFSCLCRVSKDTRRSLRVDTPLHVHLQKSVFHIHSTVVENIWKFLQGIHSSSGIEKSIWSGVYSPKHQFGTGPEELLLKNITASQEDTMCFDWMRNKAGGSAAAAVAQHPAVEGDHAMPRRFLVVDRDYIVATLERQMWNGTLGVGIILVGLWLYDFTRLRSLLDTTFVEFASADDFVLSWAQPWECYLNNNVEAKQMLDLVHMFNRSHKVNRAGQGDGGGTLHTRTARVRRLSNLEQSPISEGEAKGSAVLVANPLNSNFG